MRKQRYPRRIPKRKTCQREYKGDFLFVTLAQCALCAIMLSVAYFASSLFGMTELKPVFSEILTGETDAKEVMTQARKFLGDSYDIPLDVFSKKIFLSAPMHQPVVGTLTSPYGYREDVYTGRLDFHTGTDISAAKGTPVLAAYPGIVTEVGTSPVYGNYVTVSHGAFETRYSHCMTVTVKEGKDVAAGESIALVGSTGRSTGPHLHFELLVDGKSAYPYDELEEWTWL